MCREPMFESKNKKLMYTSVNLSFFFIRYKLEFLAPLSRRLIGELIVYQSSRRLSVSVNIFKLGISPQPVGQS